MFICPLCDSDWLLMDLFENTGSGSSFYSRPCFVCTCWLLLSLSSASPINILFSFHPSTWKYSKLNSETSDIAIHSKSEKVCRFYFSVSKNLWKKARKPQRQNFSTKVPQSIKSIKMRYSKAKCQKITKKMLSRDFRLLNFSTLFGLF